MDSPCSTKSRGSRRSNQSTFDLLKVELDKMSKNCNKYRLSSKNLQEDVLRLRKKNQDLEIKKEKSEKEYKKEIEKLNLIIKDLQNKNKSNGQRVLQPSKTLSPLNKSNFINVNGLNDSTKQLVDYTMENWMQETKKKIKLELMGKVETAKQMFLVDLEKEVNLIIDHLNTNFKKNHNENNVDDYFNLNVNPEIKLALKPLKNGVQELNQYFNFKKQDVKNKIDELEATQQLLINSLDRSKKIDSSVQNEISELSDKVNDLEDKNLQLIEDKKLALLENRKLKEINQNNEILNKQLKEDNETLLRENENLTLENEKLDRTLSVLRKENSDIKKRNDLNFELAEQTIIFKIKKDYNSLVVDINNNFSELLEELKVDINKLLTSSDKIKIYSKITQFLNKFHEFAKERFNQNHLKMENYPNMSISFMEPPLSAKKN